MQLSVLLSALISLAILAAASPTPGAISKRSFERKNLNTNLPEEGKKREELKSDFIIYAWYDGPGSGDKKRKELGSGINYDEVD
ncbi:uncharacterized protein BJ212DRAFT_1484243 [Suillus subaureus]|uniref:Uncharacterized protein n=1 Tax=Suillus subaureus TaxID=48587 RepID=A0A9P7E4V3_9AGAM|nr:uncharacterized protein BJ212DRAFT_1484243 [Suillus subaureus]KAG1810681.1 hypothetical protein BJ212DRAFT_1484243 [Suillus subaureus]